MAKRKNTQAEFIKWMGPILDALRDMGGSAKPREITQWIGDKMNITQSLLIERYQKSGELKIQNQIAWARQYLVWEEMLESSKHGTWTLTQKGWNTYLNPEKSREIFIKWVGIFRNLREKKLVEKNDEILEEVIIEQEQSKPELLQVNLQPTLLEILQTISPTGFEFICARLLREYDFEDIEISPRSHDGGIDGYATLKLNPFVNMSVYFQCKRYQGTVPTEKVQAFIGVMETNKKSVEKGLFITTGTFAKNAWEIEKANNKLELIDGEKLVDMFEKVELGVKQKIIFEPDLSFFEQYRNK